MTRSAKSRVLNFLLGDGNRTLTPKQIASRYGVKHPHSVIAKLRKAGYSITTGHRVRKPRVAVYSFSSQSA